MVEVGGLAPGFTLFDQDRRERRLGEFRGKKTLLAFFPGAFTSVCTREMCTFRDSIAELQRLEAQVVGISVNDPWSNKGFAEQNRLGFPLLSDYERRVVRLYGVPLVDLGLKGYTAAQRAVFILDRDGVVRFKWVSDDPRREPDYKELSEALSQIP